RQTLLGKMDKSEVAPPAGMFIDAKIVISSDVRFLPVVRHTIGNLTTEMGWNESDSRAITLAVEEALTNKIRHAYHGKDDGRIQMEIRTEPDALVFQLTDQGEAPDPVLICARREGSLTPGGFGTHIIRDVMDKVVYETVDEGNQLTLKKYMPGTGRALAGSE
ncbi:MAG: ATP-binding protein, partial [Bryobacteraceae bacterium]